MAEFVVVKRGVAVPARDFKIIVNAFGIFEEKAMGIIAKHGVDMSGDKPVPMEKLMEILRDVSIAFGPNLLYQVGRELPRHAVFPPGIDTIDKALRSLNIAYQMNHSGGAPGGYDVTMTKPGEIRVVADTPYPCHYDRGLLTELSLRFNRTATVQHDASAPCRRIGAASCTYYVRWS